MVPMSWMLTETEALLLNKPYLAPILLASTAFSLISVQKRKKKLKHSRVLVSTIFLCSLFLASPAQPTSFRDLSSQSIKTLFLDNHIRCAPVRRCAPQGCSRLVVPLLRKATHPPAQPPTAAPHQPHLTRKS